jgi:4-aminobutyrate aminotransferase-like enzyme
MTVIRLLPPLVITYEQIDHLVDALTEVLVCGYQWKPMD